MARTVQRPAFLNDDNSYDLLFPVTYTVGGVDETLTRLQLRRLTAIEVLITEESIRPTEMILKIVEHQTGLVRVVTQRMDAVDLDRLDTIIGFFRQPGSATGAIS